MAEQHKRVLNLTSIVVCTVGVALTVLVVLLGAQNIALKQQIAGASPRRASLSPGDSIGIRSLVDLVGLETPLAFPAAEDRTLMFLFTSTCPACKEAIPVWNEIVSADRSQALRVVGVRLGEPGGADGIPDTGHDFDVYQPGESSGEWLRQNVPMVPATIVLDRKGAVVEVWVGTLDESNRRDLEEVLRS